MDTDPSETYDDEDDALDSNQLDDLLDSVVPESVPAIPLSEAELQFVTFVHQVYALEGTLISQQSAMELLDMTPKDYDTLMADERVLAALTERGVRPPVGKSDTTGDTNVTSIVQWQKKLKTQALTPQQLIVANTMLDLVDTRSQKKKLQDLNVSTMTYNMWLKDPVFQNYMRERADSMLGENQHEAHLALLDKVRMGDIKAITLYYEMRGIYTPVTASQVNANQVEVDVRNLIASIIEIITDEVDDYNTASRIADRMKGLIQARTIANELVNSHVASDGTVLHVPEVMESPTLSPQLMAAIGKQDGNDNG